MTASFAAGTPLWEPSEEVKQKANVTQYIQWLAREKGLTFQIYEELWEWSLSHLEDFWASLWDYFHIQAVQSYSTVLVERTMPGAQWFLGAEWMGISMVENCLTGFPLSLICNSSCLACKRRCWCLPSRRMREQKASAIPSSVRMCFRENMHDVEYFVTKSSLEWCVSQ